MAGLNLSSAQPGSSANGTRRVCGRWKAKLRLSEPRIGRAARTNRAERETTMRSILLYLIGVPLPIILLLAMCSHHF